MPDQHGWYEQGITPKRGVRYEFEDFVGARFTATFDRYRSLRQPAGGGKTLLLEGGEDLFLRLEFTDHDPFETNVPIRFRDAGDA